MTKPTEKEKVLFPLPPSALFKSKCNPGAALWQSGVNSSSGTLPSPCEVLISRALPRSGDLAAPGVCHIHSGPDRHTDQGISSTHTPELLCSHQSRSSRRTRIKLNISFAQAEMGAGFSRLPELAAQGSSSSREQMLTHFHYSSSSCQDCWACSDPAHQSMDLVEQTLLSRTLCSTHRELWNIPPNAPTSPATPPPSSELILILMITIYVIILIPTISI